jgi:phosphoribosylformimino-5-aminoimidazole carboxamide ribotide isomerase
MDIIPAIDIIDGKCVRLTRGDYNTKKIYADSPVEIAKTFIDSGFKRIHIVDLDGAKSGSPVNLKILEQIASEGALVIQFGGGVKSEESLMSVLDAGATKVICGTVAFTKPEKFSGWIKKYSHEKIILGADFREGKIAVNGWEKQTEALIDDVVERFYRNGIREIIATDISRDGMMSGINASTYYSIKEKFPLLRIIISGGISSVEDIEGIDGRKIDGVVVGKAIYEGKIKLEELSRCCRKE